MYLVPDSCRPNWEMPVRIQDGHPQKDRLGLVPSWTVTWERQDCVCGTPFLLASSFLAPPLCDHHLFQPLSFIPRGIAAFAPVLSAARLNPLPPSFTSRPLIYSSAVHSLQRPSSILRPCDPKVKRSLPVSSDTQTNRHEHALHSAGSEDRATIRLSLFVSQAFHLQTVARRRLL